MTDDQRLRHALAWSGGAAIAISVVQLGLASSGPMTGHLWIVIGASFAGQIAALIAAALILTGMLRSQDIEVIGSKLTRLIPLGLTGLAVTLLLALIVGSIQLGFVNGLVAAAIGAVLGLQGVAGIWIGARSLAGTPT